MPNRGITSSVFYRNGFNGKEKDLEINGSEGAYDDFGARMYDARLRRFLARDPLAYTNASQSPYSFAINCPIMMVDEEGENPHISTYEYKGNTFIQINSRESILGSKRRIEKGKSVEITEWETHSMQDLQKEVLFEINKSPSRDPVTFGYKSMSGNSYDYLKYFAPNTLHFIDGIAYNEHEALNFLWGATTYALGYPEHWALYGAEKYSNFAYNESNEKSENDAIRQGFYTLFDKESRIFTSFNKNLYFKNKGVQWNGSKNFTHKQPNRTSHTNVLRM